MRVCFDSFCFLSSRLTNDGEPEETLTTGPSNSSSTVITSEAMGTVNVEELQVLLQCKETKVHELEEKVRVQNEEILQLRSQLDKFQSVFPYHNPHLNNNININLARPRKQRAQGISAEPQSLISLQEINQQTLPSYPKKDK
ncbi:hypothetical protein WDU94_004026 [Cyamophila willieti]